MNQLKKIMIKKAKNISTEMKKIWQFAKNNLVIAQKIQKRFADIHKTKTSNYKIKNKIWLSIHNLKTKKSFRKLNHKMIDSFEIKKILGQSCQLKLSQSMKIHDIFHTFLFRPNADDSFDGQIQPSSLSVIINEKTNMK